MSQQTSLPLIRDDGQLYAPVSEVTRPCRWGARWRHSVQTGEADVEAKTVDALAEARQDPGDQVDVACLAARTTTEGGQR